LRRVFFKRDWKKDILVTVKAKRKRQPKAEREFSQTRGILWLWVGLLTAPLAFLLHLQVNYMLVTQLCQSERKIILHLVTLAFLLIAVGGGFIAWRNWAASGRKWPGEAESVNERSRFMSVVGLLISALIVIALIAQLIPQFIYDPCHR
jgi:TRAP-type C4-dicarboxylate transport system permease small subunit